MRDRRVVKIFIYCIVVVAVFAAVGCLGAPPGQGEDRPMTNAEFVFMTVWFILLGVAVYFFLVSKPRFDREDQQKKFVESLKKHDEVMTSGGIFGRVVSTRSDFITIEIAPNVRIKVKADHIHKPQIEESRDKSAEA